MSWANTKSNKDHYIKFKLAIACFSWCKCFYVMSNFEDWETIIHFGNFFGSIGEKTYFLALGTTPVKGVGFIAGKITVLGKPGEYKGLKGKAEFYRMMTLSQTRGPVVL